MGESSELFVNCLEAMVETCLPVEDATTVPPSPKPYHLSSSLSSLTLGSPTDKGKIRMRPVANPTSLLNSRSLSVSSVAFSTESLDCHEAFGGSVSSLRRASCSKTRAAAAAKLRMTESPTQGLK